MTGPPLEVTPALRQLALEILECKRNVEWLVQMQSRARGLGMPVLVAAIADELRIQRGMFWARSDQLGITGLSVAQINDLARRLEQAAGAGG